MTSGTKPSFDISKPVSYKGDFVTLDVAGLEAKAKAQAYLVLDDPSNVKMFARDGEDVGYEGAENILTWKYEEISAIAWDHQHSSAKFSSKAATAGKRATYSVTVETTGTKWHHARLRTYIQFHL